jgi:hypothetical protein
MAVHLKKEIIHAQLNVPDEISEGFFVGMSLACV